MEREKMKVLRGVLTSRPTPLVNQFKQTWTCGAILRVQKHLKRR